ncbi:MAG TPA: G-D-S-L family lipolytic protein, partial [Sphingobacterium sp.]|nr:G-D-S-L family lipolytic protein [Sphingobacterium sp.]
MKRLNKRISLYISLFAVAIVSSCAPSFDDYASQSTGQAQADFSKFIAVGNSLTAGFADGGLYLEGQRNAFPNIIAEQMQIIGGGSFNAPFFSAEQANGSGYLRLKDLVNGNPVIENVTDRLAYREPAKLTKYTGEIHNLGVPGMRLDHSGVELVSVANMYFERLLPDSEVGTKSYMDFVSNRNHTFFSFWLGNNDALGYATNGAVDAQNGTTTLTSVAVFTAMYTNFINALTANDREGVVATIPDVTAVPYFTAVTRTVLLQAASAVAGMPIDKLFIATKSGTREATDKDMFVLPFSSAG